MHLSLAQSTVWCHEQSVLMRAVQLGWLSLAAAITWTQLYCHVAIYCHKTPIGDSSSILTWKCISVLRILQLHILKCRSHCRPPPMTNEYFAPLAPSSVHPCVSFVQTDSRMQWRMRWFIAVCRMYFHIKSITHKQFKKIYRSIVLFVLNSAPEERLRFTRVEKEQLHARATDDQNKTNRTRFGKQFHLHRTRQPRTEERNPRNGNAVDIFPQ
jgi:hypothetical protein